MPDIGNVKSKMILGTRGSALALAQTQLVREALGRISPDLQMEVREITTSGDTASNLKLSMESGAGAKGLFTKEIETALLNQSIDVAVHSLKDLPGHSLSPELEITAVLPRAAISDVLITKKKCKLQELPQEAVVGTSSVRRKFQLLHLRKDLIVEEFRGNVQTRLRKLLASDRMEGIVLARAGLERLGLISAGNELIFEGNIFHVEDLSGCMLPAIGQGVIALQQRVSDKEVREILERISDGKTFRAVRAERELLRLLNGNCYLPVGARSSMDGEKLSMEMIVFRDDGSEPKTGFATGPADQPEQVARELYKQIYG